jgi:hypothetical protein
LVGIGLSDEFNDDFEFFAAPSDAPSGMMLGHGSAHYDVALLDTGAAVSVLTAQADSDFNIDGPYPGESDGFRGTEEIQIGGATGILFATINDPLGLYAGGLQGRTSTGPLVMNHSAFEGQTNTSLITIPPESDLPNVLGLTFASQYATYIRNDMPQLLSVGGKTVRTPSIDFLPLESGGQGISRRAPLSLNPGASFQQPPFWFYNINLDIDNPHENPSQPTVIQGGMFLSVNVENEGEELQNFEFLFDTGADVTVVSELNAARLGFDVVLDEPDFTVAVVGSGGVNLEVPGFFVEQFTIQAIGGSVTATNVPIVVLDVTDPSDPGNVVDGIVGTNLLSGRNLVIDPNPSLGGGGVGPSLYISDPVTNPRNWATAAASGVFGSGGNWTGSLVPTTLSVANVRHVSGGHQTAVLNASTTVWELNVSGSGTSQTMSVAVQNGVTLTTFSGINIETAGVIHLQGGTFDTQYVEILGGSLRGSGTIVTGSGPIPGQVENRRGLVAPGNGIGTLNIEGRFANGVDGTLVFDLGGTIAGVQYDQLVVDGAVTVEGTLAVSLADLGGGQFTPNVGNSFTLLTATEDLGGVFDTYVLPSGFVWNVLYGEDSITLNAIGIGISGDFNLNGVVDAADYVVWRSGLGTTYQQADYKIWKANYGKTPGDLGVSTGLLGAVPEPASCWMLVAGTLHWGMAALRRAAR